MRKFSFITVGEILNQLREELMDHLPQDKLWYIDKNGKKRKKYPISRMTFYRIEAKLGFPQSKEDRDKGEWRTYTPKESEMIKNKVKERYGYV